MPQQISTLDAGQPLDLGYMLSMVTQLNNLSTAIGNQGISKIRNPSSGSLEAKNTASLSFYAAKNSLSPNFVDNSNLTTTFDFNFEVAPIVTTSVEVSGSSAPIFAVVTNVTNTQCQVKLFSAGTITTTPQNVGVSIIAIGKPPLQQL